MKKAKNLIIMASVLAVLLIVYFVFSAVQGNGGDDTTAPVPSHTVAVIDAEKLCGIKITVTKEEKSEATDTTDETSAETVTGRVSETLIFTLSDDETKWIWSEDGEIPLDNNAFATIVTALNGATSAYKLEGVSNSQLEEYGLDDPYMRVGFNFSDGTSKEFKIGDYNAFNGLYYFVDVSVPTTVYMIDNTVTNALDLEIFDFVLEDTAPAIKETNLISVTYTTPKGERVYTYYPTGKSDDYTDKYLWYCSDNYDVQTEYAVDSDLAATLVELITGMSFDECVALDFAADSSYYDFSDDSEVVIKYKADTDENGVLTEQTYTLYIGSISENGVYVHNDNSKLVYLIDDGADWNVLLHGEKYSIAPDELWQPNYETIDMLTFTAGDRKLEVTVTEEDGKVTYSADGAKDDAIIKLLEELEKMRAQTNTAILEENTAVDKKVYFSMSIEPLGLTMTAESYAENYCRVSFGERNDQLITVEDAETFAKLIADTVGA